MSTHEAKPRGDNSHEALQQLEDEALLQRLCELLSQDRTLEAELLAHLGEVDHRKLYRERAFSSMFQYCVGELHLSESVAYKRITVARAAREYPVLLTKVARGELHLTGACLLVPHLTQANVEELLEAATHQSKRKIEQLLASRFPRPDAPARIRKLPSPHLADPEPTQGEVHAKSLPLASSPHDKPVSPARRAEVTPLSSERFKVQFTADAQLRGKLQQAQDLLGPSVPRNDLAALFSKALDALISDLQNKKHGVTSRTRRSRQPEPGAGMRSRTIPRSVRRAVYERDAGQCAYVSREGRRCPERSGLEYHHRVPFGLGGQSIEENVELRCKSHNQLAAEQDYGGKKMSRFWRGGVKEGRVPYRVSESRASEAGSGSSCARVGGQAVEVWEVSSPLCCAGGGYDSLPRAIAGLPAAQRSGLSCRPLTRLSLGRSSGTTWARPLGIPG